MKNYKYIPSILLLILFVQFSYSQMIITDAKNSTGDLQLEKKMATTDDVVGIGEYYYYEIAFLDYNAANTELEITDILPSGLEYVSYEALVGSFVKVSGATPNNHDPITSPVIVSGQTITFKNLDIYTKGTFRIKVRFPDSACNGYIITNNVCATYTNTITDLTENVCTTSGLTTRAEGIDPWAKVTKKPMYPAVFDNQNNWYIDINNPVVKYKVTIEKNPQYANLISGTLSLSDITIQDILLSGGIITSINPSTGFTQSGNDIVFNSSTIWSGNTNSFRKEFIIEVDYSGATTPLVVGQIITNTVNLIGKTCDDQTSIIKGSGSANVIVTDTLPVPFPSAYLVKTVNMTNRVVGCMGTYTIMYKNTNNRPISNIIITDNLPDDIQPIGSIIVSKSINSASVGNTFDVDFNNTPITSFPTIIPLSGNTLKISASTTPNTVLYPNDFVQVQFNYILRSSPLNGVVTNCVNATGNIVGLTTQLTDSHCVSFSVENPAPKICIDKQVRKLQGGSSTGWTNAILDAKPGDELEFRVRIVNYGSSQFIGGTLTDVLDPKFIFQGFSNTPSGIIANQVGQNLDWSNINIGSNCSVSNNAGCSTAYPYVDITFKVKVAPYTPPGQINNIARVNGNIPNILQDIATVRVVNSFVIDITKEISKNGLVWTDYLVESPGYSGTIQYRLKVENIGNMPVLNHEVYDELPLLGDIVYPTSNSRGTNFPAPLTGINLISHPNYSASIIPSAARVTSCGDVPSAALGTTIKYVSNSVLNPTDVFIMQFSGTLPAGLTSGHVAVNHAYFLDCSGNTNIITPSKLATLEIYQPPCETCPEGTEIEGFSVSNSIVNIPETGVHSELEGIPVYNEDIQLQTNWQWVTGVRVYVSEFEPVYQDGCESCHFNMDQVGNLVNNMFPAQLGQLTKVATDYHGANQDFVREIIYKGLPDISFRNGISTNIAISLPDMINPNCCVVSYNVCLKYVFEGPNCENCELEYCFTAPEGPIHPVFCPDPTVEIVELGKPNSDCCQKVLVPRIQPCTTGAIYRWYGPQGFIVQQGTTTATSDGRLFATENGNYRLEVQCPCPDGTLTQVTTANYTVSGILGNAPTSPEIVAHNMRRTLSGGVYTANLTFSINPIYYQFGFRVEVQQAYTSLINPLQWEDLVFTTMDKEICSENGTDFSLNFNYNKPGQKQNRWWETWQENYRIVIKWKGCDGIVYSSYFPITNIGILNVFMSNPRNPRQFTPRN